MTFDVFIKPNLKRVGDRFENYSSALLILAPSFIYVFTFAFITALAEVLVLASIHHPVVSLRLHSICR